MERGGRRTYRVGPGDGVRRFWEGGQPSVSGGRLTREGFFYYAFKGWPVADLQQIFSGELAQDLARAFLVVYDEDALAIGRGFFMHDAGGGR